VLDKIAPIGTTHPSRKQMLSVKAAVWLSDPPFTDEDVEQIVCEVYGIPKPIPVTADIEF